jgi:GNAT superfamily N-acetyltransferase
MRPLSNPHNDDSIEANRATTHGGCIVWRSRVPFALFASIGSSHFDVLITSTRKTRHFHSKEQGRIISSATKMIVCKLVNYSDPRQGAVLTKLLNAYATDHLGGGTPLKDEVLEQLPARLAMIPHAFSFVAYAAAHDTAASSAEGEQGNNEAAIVEATATCTPAGLVNCFEGFSTFAAKPLVNVHDMYVADAFRGQGVSQALMAAVEKEARARGCCKMTLECLSKNQIALNAYKKCGFGSYELNPEHGVAVFLEKKLEY